MDANLCLVVISIFLKKTLLTSHLYDSLTGFCVANNLIWLDHIPDGVDYTVDNDTAGRYSLIDHFICSPGLTGSSTAVHILNDGDNISDHLAIMCQLTVAANLYKTKSTTCSHVKLMWEKANLDVYQSGLSTALSSIELPVDALCCTAPNCQIHYDQLECYHNAIVQCLNTASQYIPSIKVGSQKHWWRPDLDELKQKCIDMTHLWSSVGRPRSGSINAERLRCKYAYKQAIKAARQENDREFNDDLLDKFCQKDDVNFWKSWRKRFCSNSLKPTNMLNVSGTSNVMNEFSEYYSRVMQPNTMNADAFMNDEVVYLLQNEQYLESDSPVVTISDIEFCIGNLKRNKAAGPDNITSEHVIFGGPSLNVHLSLLYSAMICHSFVPVGFTYGIIIPLLKNKHGNPTNIDMYRGITLSSVLSIVFEYVLVRFYDVFLKSDLLQFGFKKQSSCNHALFTLSETVKHFTKKGSRVHCAFLDASKAFDKVLHNGIFLKLLKHGAPRVFVLLLKRWHNGLHCSVKWNDLLGEPFSVACGVRQCGILSPYLFAVYVNELIEQLRKSGHGLHIGHLFVGCAVYADDIVLMSASCYGLQKLVDICTQYGVLWDIKFNTLKSQLITFGACNPTHCSINMNNVPIFLGCQR